MLKNIMLKAMQESKIKQSFNDWLYKKAIPNNLKDKIKLKIDAFEYFVFLLIKWWAEENPDKEFKENDLSTLKTILLLWLLTASSADETNNGLLEIFDNWWAAPFGCEERDVLKEIKLRKGQFSYFKIDNKGIELTDYPPKEWL